MGSCSANKRLFTAVSLDLLQLINGVAQPCVDAKGDYTLPSVQPVRGGKRRQTLFFGDWDASRSILFRGYQQVAFIMPRLVSVKWYESSRNHQAMLPRLCGRALMQEVGL